MRNQEWNPLLPKLHALHFSQLIRRFLAGDAMYGESTFCIVDETEILARLVDGDDVHVAGRVGRIGTYLAVDFDEALHKDGFGFAGVEGIF